MDTANPINPMASKLTGRPSSRPRRVLHVITRMRPGGAETAIMNLYRQIDRDQIQFDFAVRTTRPAFYDEEIRALGGRLFHLPWFAGNPLSIFGYRRALDRILRNEGPFIALHTHFGLHSGYILPVGRKAGMQLRIAHSHSAASDKESFLRTIWGAVMRRNIRMHATHILACSSLAARWLYGSRWPHDERVLLFPNAIELDEYADLGDDRTRWRKALGLPLEGPLIGHVGRFDPVKNHAFLVEVFAAFRQRCSRTKLILVGEGELQEDVVRQVEAAGVEDAVYFMGARSDVPQILAALDLFMLPSHHEGLGIVLIEAQAAGVPCLCSDAVSGEVDLGLDLVHREKLASGVETWVQQIMMLLDVEPVGWEKRKCALRNGGYDVKRSVQSLEELYLSAV